MNDETLREIAERATPGDLDTTPNDGGEYGYRESGKWYDCPACDGSGSVEGATYCNFDDFAMGVQFFGVGNEFKVYEEFFRTFRPATVLSLLDRALAAEGALLRRVREDNDCRPDHELRPDCHGLNAEKCGCALEACALLSLAHGGVEGMMGASRASRASEGLRPFASDSAAEVGGSE